MDEGGEKEEGKGGGSTRISIQGLQLRNAVPGVVVAEKEGGSWAA